MQASIICIFGIPYQICQNIITVCIIQELSTVDQLEEINNFIHNYKIIYINFLAECQEHYDCCYMYNPHPVLPGNMLPYSGKFSWGFIFVVFVTESPKAKN